MRHRLTIGGTALAVLLLAPGIAQAANNPVAGTAKGKAVLVIVPSVATCVNPPVQSTDNFCKWNFRGSYSTGGPFLGTGRYTGRVTLNFAAYGANATYGENCFSDFTGVIKFTNASGTLRTVVDRSSSFICDDASGTKRDTHLVLTVPPGSQVGASATFGGVVQNT
jgi:hypothetical protein